MKDKLWSLARNYWFDVLIVGGLIVTLGRTVNAQHASGGPGGPLWFDVLAVLGIYLPLFARRRFPFAASMASLAVLGLASFVDAKVGSGTPAFFLGGCAALFLLGSLRSRSQAFAGLAVGAGVVAATAHNDPTTSGSSDYIWLGLFFAGAWIVGFTIGRKLWEAADARERADRAEREREDQARLAVAEERARIARELHDVVGHAGQCDDRPGVRSTNAAQAGPGARARSAARRRADGPPGARGDAPHGRRPAEPR